jgi:hypothetical protein
MENASTPRHLYDDLDTLSSKELIQTIAAFYEEHRIASSQPLLLQTSIIPLNALAPPKEPNLPSENQVQEELSKVQRLISEETLHQDLSSLVQGIFLPGGKDALMNFVEKIDSETQRLRASRDAIKEIGRLFGEKTAGLLDLEQKLQGVIKDSDLVKVLIPPFLGISHNKIKSLLDMELKKNSGKDLVQRWGEVLHELKCTPLVPQNSSAYIQLTTLQREIETLLSGLDETALSHLLAPEELNQMRTFGMVMVRSSSQEENKEAQNPGGNLSLPAFSTSWDELRGSMARVIGGYFSPQSIRQRSTHTSNGLQPSALLPTCSLLIQKFIGHEPSSFIKEQVPLSGVLFSQHLIGGESAPVPLVSIKVAYGHGSYVTESQGPLTQYLISDTLALYAFKRQQHFQNIPSIVREGEQAKNSVKLIKVQLDIPEAPTLPEKTLKTLHSVARALETAFGHVVDLEFIYQPTTTSLYLVQARDPSIHFSDHDFLHRVRPQRINIHKIPQHLGKRSYFKLCPIELYTVHLFQVLQGKIVGEKVLFTSDSTAAQALSELPATERPPFVIVENGSLESHGAIALQALGISLLRASPEHYKEISLLIDGGFCCYILDPETGIIAFKKTQKELEDAISHGYGGYPLPLGESIEPLTPSMSLYLTSIGTAQKAYADEILDKVRLVPREKYSSGTPISTLFQEMKDGSTHEAISALAEFAGRLWPDNPNSENLTKRGVLEQRALHAICCLYDALSSENDPEDPWKRLVRLFYIHSIERLWFQEESLDLETSISLMQKWAMSYRIKKLDSVSHHVNLVEELQEKKEILLRLSHKIKDPKERKELRDNLSGCFEQLSDAQDATKAFEAAAIINGFSKILENMHWERASLDTWLNQHALECSRNHSAINQFLHQLKEEI